MENAIRTMRKSAGLTQRALAEKSGVSVHTIEKIENGQRKGRTETLETLFQTIEQHKQKG